MSLDTDLREFLHTIRTEPLTFESPPSPLLGNEAGAVLAFPMTQQDDDLAKLKDMSPSAAVGIFKGTPVPSLVLPAGIEARPLNW